ncbi:hypothetical protein KY362_05160, partial [Candidatus Woesearchaeota archaeon]|nr:hypothetical protein [Candidatus Woesearchaeota archaeon]
QEQIQPGRWVLVDRVSPWRPASMSGVERQVLIGEVLAPFVANTEAVVNKTGMEKHDALPIPALQHYAQTYERNLRQGWQGETRGDAVVYITDWGMMRQSCTGREDSNPKITRHPLRRKDDAQENDEAVICIFNKVEELEEHLRTHYDFMTSRRLTDQWGRVQSEEPILFPWRGGEKEVPARYMGEK